MTEIERIFLTSGLTIFGGIVVLVLGQIITKFHLEPLHELRMLLGNISDTLVLHANVCTNPGLRPREPMDAASRVLREEASLLRARAHALPCYIVYVFLRVVPKSKSLQEASRLLTALTNAAYVEGQGMENHRRAGLGRKLLGLPPE